MILLVGVGYMGKEYARVLKSQQQDFFAVGNSEVNADRFRCEFNVEVITGGVVSALSGDISVPNSAIVCTPVDVLAKTVKCLIANGVKKILVEKPGALSIQELQELEVLASRNNVDIFIAYNRRFYQSVQALKERLESEEIIAVNFELTEWSHLVVHELCSDEVKQKWFLANTSHVVDLAFHLSGKPQSLATHTAGEGCLKWHESASRFVGSGVTESNVLISYCGYWDGPGRWSVEIVTTQNRYVLRPMERLQAQAIGSVTIAEVDSVNYSLDEEYKPGLFLLTAAFLAERCDDLVSISEQIDSYKIYNKMANYN